VFDKTSVAPTLKMPGLKDLLLLLEVKVHQS